MGERSLSAIGSRSVTGPDFLLKCLKNPLYFKRFETPRIIAVEFLYEASVGQRKDFQVAGLFELLLEERLSFSPLPADVVCHAVLPDFRIWMHSAENMLGFPLFFTTTAEFVEAYGTVHETCGFLVIYYLQAELAETEAQLDIFRTETEFGTKHPVFFEEGFLAGRSPPPEMFVGKNLPVPDFGIGKQLLPCFSDIAHQLGHLQGRRPGRVAQYRNIFLGMVFV